MIKRLVILFLASILLTGCTSNKQEEIIFSSWGSITEVKILNKIINDFEKENPNINVKFIHIPQNYFQKLHLLFASNTAPDVLFINNLNLPIYESKLEDLTNLVQQEEFFPQSITGLKYKNKLLAIPRDISNLVFYINLDIADLPDEEWSIDALYENAKKYTNDSHWGISCEQDIYWALPYLSYFNGGILDENFNTIIDSKESKQAISLYKSLYEKYNYAPTRSQVGSSTLAQMFLDKKIVFYLSGRWMYPKISEKADFSWAVINFPVGKNPQPSDCSGWAISKDSKHKEASKKFVKFLSDEKSSKYFTETGLIVPARMNIAKNIVSEKHNESAFIKAIEISKPTPVNKNYKKMIDEINIKYFK